MTMPSPVWLAYAFAAVMAVDGAYCLARVVAGPRTGLHAHADIDAGHVLMAVAMVGMLVPAWHVLPVAAWEVVFGAMAAWFLARSVRAAGRAGAGALATAGGGRARHYLVHFVMACAMLDMYWLGMPMTGPPAHAGMAMGAVPAGGGGPTLTAFLVLVMLASAVWQLDTLGRRAPAPAPVPVPVPATGSPVVVGARSPAPAGAGGGPAPSGAGSTARRWDARGYAVGCHVAMCVTMAYMLVLML